MKAVLRVATGVWILGAEIMPASVAGAQTPAENTPPPTWSSAPQSTYPPPPAAVQTGAVAPAPALIPINAPRGAIIAWLSRNVPASHGRLVYINGEEAFWIEHQDVDPKNPMKITATLHAENFADPGATWRSSYQVTQFDCETQQQFHFYFTRYSGNGLAGEVTKEGQIIRHSDFVSPISLDFAHLRVVCLDAYDQIRKRAYTIQMPAN